MGTLIQFQQAVILLVVYYLLHVRAEGKVGDACRKEGVPGICTHVYKCQSAVDDIRNKKLPQICSFQGRDPIVCCQHTSTMATTTGSGKPQLNPHTNTTRTTTEYIPFVDEGYPLYDEYISDCVPLDKSLTSPRTRQKAWNKCLDYHEQFVYPCMKGVPLTGNLMRENFCKHNSDELIIGGTNALENEFPHMALLGYGEPPNIEWLCGGALISEKFILTAGHCSSERNNGMVRYATVGRIRFSDTAKKYKIGKIHNHPDFKPPAKYNDIALLETEEVIQLSSTTVPACLHVEDTIEEHALVTGWGRNSYKDNINDKLQKVPLKKFTEPECNDKYPLTRLIRRGIDYQSQVCYGDQSMTNNTCLMISGSPLQIKSRKIHCMYVVIGVTSFGRHCRTFDNPDVFTRVVRYVPWIESVVWPDN